MAGENAHRVFPHGDFETLAPGLWRVIGSLPSPLKRNMFAYRLRDGGLLLYSAVALNDAGLAALEALGRPAVLVVPHPFHIMDAPFYGRRYPEIRVVGAADAQARLPTLKFDATPEQALPALGLGSHVVPGMKYGEVVLELPVEGGTALLFTDLLGQNEGPTSLMMKILGPPGGQGVARIVRFRQVKDKARVRAFLRERARTPGLRLVAGCHGGVVTRACGAWLDRAAAGL